MYNTLKGIKNTKAQYELIQFINSLLPSRIDEKAINDIERMCDESEYSDEVILHAFLNARKEIENSDKSLRWKMSYLFGIAEKGFQKAAEQNERKKQ